MDQLRRPRDRDGCRAQGDGTPRRARATSTRPGSRLARALALAAVLAACTRAYDVGDHVLVEWEGKSYPAMVLDVPGPGKVKVHYDGYDEMWDEIIPRSRLKGRIEGPISNVPEPPEKVRRAAADASKNNKYKLGDRVTVEFHRHFYPAVIVGVVGPEKYRVHYEGYGNEWDENVGPERIRAKTP